MITFSTLVGTVGVGILLFAFFLVTFRLIGQNGKLYSSLNIVGALLACYASVLIDYIPFVVLEGAWAAVACVGLAKAVKPGAEQN